MEPSRVRELARRIVGAWTDPILRIKAVHDWIILNTAYDETVLEGRDAPSAVYRAEGVLERRKAVCSGYAHAVELLLQALEIPVLYVTNANHAWNMVQVRNVWYHLDVTWDDPIPDTPGQVLYTYFLLSSATLAMSRTFRESRPAPADYLATVREWDGRPVVHAVQEAEAAFRSVSPSVRPVSLLVWKTDPEEVVDRVRRAFGRGMFGPVDPRIRWSVWTSGTPLGEVRFGATREEVERIPAPVLPPPVGDGLPVAGWFRLRGPGIQDVLTVRMDASQAPFRLDRTSAMALDGIRDEAGRPFHRYFEKGGDPLLEFNIAGGRWAVRAPTGAVNGFLRNGSPVGPEWTPIAVGDLLTLVSRRQGRAVPSLTLRVSDR
ncbi:hypothetical protein KBD49_00100 [Myxococcota bacterium]|nr:hypothetical protein [Myxococcota bacterium]